MRQILWVVGEPGVGKTTLVRHLLAENGDLSGAPYTFNAKPKWTIGKEVAAAGHYLGQKFDGADMVPYNGVKQALEFWQEYVGPRCKLTIFDGDRFSNSGVIDFFREATGPIDLRVVLLQNSEVAAARRAERGTTQDPAWVRGRKTKAERFITLFSRVMVIGLLGTEPPSFVANKVKTWLTTTG